MRTKGKSFLRLAAFGVSLLTLGCGGSSLLPGGTPQPGGTGGAGAGSGTTTPGTGGASSCGAGTMVCGDGTCAPTSWSFEMGGVQGWAPADPSTAKVSTTTVRSSDGLSSLEGQNPPDNFDVLLKVPICNGESTNLAGKRISMKVALDFEVVTQLKLGRTCAVWWNGDSSSQGDSCSSDASPGWHQIDQAIDNSGGNVTAIGVEVQMFSGSMYSSAGTVYVDDVRISD